MLKFTTALGLTILVAAQALAQSSNRERAAPPEVFTDHLRAYNQLQPGESVDREQAIRECNEQGRRYAQHLWGNMEFDVYRSCMAQRGLRE
jgi:hypothetical protein